MAEQMLFSVRDSAVGDEKPSGSKAVTGYPAAMLDRLRAADSRLHVIASGGIGSLDDVTRVVKLLGMVNCAPGFNQTPAVIDGCSNLLLEVFGDAGKHARSAVGQAELPFDISVEIEMVVEVSG